MSKANSTAPAATDKPDKPSKPYPDFPLFPHAAGVWAKKIRGKMHYFGPWADPDGALAKYLEQKDALHAGRKPRPDPEALTVKALANTFLNHKQALLDAGELSPRTWMNSKEATDLVVKRIRQAARLSPTWGQTTSQPYGTRWPGSGGRFGSGTLCSASAACSSTPTTRA